MLPVSPSRTAAVAVPLLLIALTAAGAPDDAPAAARSAVVAQVASGTTGGAVAVTRPAPLAATERASAYVAPATAVNTEPDSGESASTDAALRALGSRVRKSSHPDALRTAFTAYYNYRDANPDAVTKPYLYYVDMGLDNRTARGYVFDMDQLTIVDGPFTVAHGRGSARTRDAIPSSFSNRPGSNATSLGLYLAQETYTFSGKSGGRRYTSVGLRMRGESGEFNSAARRRGIVAHGAPYVSAGHAGRSEGCPAMEMRRAQRLLPMIANGGVVFIYSPKDARWLDSDPWID
jgi:hypothetical protein